MEELENLIRGFFGTLFGILIGTVIVSQGEMIGIVFYGIALFSAIMLICNLIKFLGGKNENRE